MKVSRSDIQLETVVSRIRLGEWDLQPDFQRGEVWDRKRRQRLIDTILRGWYIPAVHIVVNDDGTEVVLDGQQRLAAIRDFFDETIKVDGSLDPHNADIAQLDGCAYSELPEATRRSVNRFMITVVELTQFEVAEPNELFFRLNQAYSLTPSEKRNALLGPARHQVRGLVDELEKCGLLASQRIGFSNGRLAYDDIVARSCLVTQQNTARQHVNNTVVENFYRTNEFSDETLAGISTAGQVLLDQVLRTEGQRVRFNKGTLQTWLLYCHWATSLTPLPDSLLAEFELLRGALKSNQLAHMSIDRGVVAMMRLYEDRASYRVTDVSSVLIRDLAIHLFAQGVFHAPAHLESDQLLGALSSTPEVAASLVAEFLEASSWGAPLIPAATR